MDYDINRKGWFGEAHEFANVLAPISSYPLAYVYATFLGVSGHVIGRKAFVRYGASEMYPNHFIALLGGSGTHHKSTALKAATRTLGRDRMEEHPPIRTLTTEQGLLQAMSNFGGQALVVLDELSAMLQKKKQDFGASLLARLTELYDSPDVAGNYTKYDPIIVTDPTLTFMSASTVDWLRDTLSTADLMAGFGNRMTWITGDPRAAKAWPRPNSGPGFESNWSTLEAFEGELRLSEHGMDVWEHFYKRFTSTQLRATPFQRVLAERVPEKVLKAAMVQAAWSQSHLIDEDILQSAIDWGRYCYQSITEIAPNFEQTEHKVLATIRAGKNTKRKLYSELGTEIQVERIKKALDNLRWLGILSIEQDGTYTPTERALEIEEA